MEPEPPFDDDERPGAVAAALRLLLAMVLLICALRFAAIETDRNNKGFSHSMSVLKSKAPVGCALKPTATAADQAGGPSLEASPH